MRTYSLKLADPRVDPPINSSVFLVNFGEQHAQDTEEAPTAASESRPGRARHAKQKGMPSPMALVIFAAGTITGAAGAVAGLVGASFISI